MKICQSKALSIFDYREIDLSQYAAPFSMNNEELEEKLTKFRTRHAPMTEADSVETGDFVTLDTVSETPRFRKTGVTLRVGKGLFSRELEQAILGMRVGEPRTIALPDAAAHVTIRSIRRRTLPPLTDDTVASWGIEGAKTVEQLIAVVKEEAQSQYIADTAESVAVAVSGEANRRSVFDLDEEEIRTVEDEGRNMAEDMLRSAELDPATATDEEVLAVSGRTKQEHFDFLRWLSLDGLKSAVIGELMMERDGVEVRAEDYPAALQSCADGMGVTLEEAGKILPYDKFLRQTAATYYFEQIENYVKIYLERK